MRLSEIMTVNVETVRPSASVREAAAKMAAFDIASLPVCEGRKVLGQVTDRDITIKVIAEGMNPEDVTVGDIMTTPAVWAPQEMDVTKAAELMSHHQIRRLVVVDQNKDLVGIVAAGDIAREADDLADRVAEGRSKPVVFRH